MDEAALLARMQEQRMHWVSLPDGKRVRFRRPFETEFPKFRAGITAEHVCEYVCGWEGFTEADLLGAAVGASDPVPYSAALWAQVLRDRVDYLAAVSEAIVTSITSHIEAKAATEKN